MKRYLYRVEVEGDESVAGQMFYQSRRAAERKVAAIAEHRGLKASVVQSNPVTWPEANPQYVAYVKDGQILSVERADARTPADQVLSRIQRQIEALNEGMQMLLGGAQ